MFLDEILEIMRSTRQDFLRSNEPSDILMDFGTFDAIYSHLKEYRARVGNIPSPGRASSGFDDYNRADAKASWESQSHFREANERLRREREKAQAERARREEASRRAREEEMYRYAQEEALRWNQQKWKSFFDDHFDAGYRSGFWNGARPKTTGKPWYEVLGLRPEATMPQRVKAYRSLAQKFHPDKPGGSHEKMSELNQAKKEAGIS